jgi:alpha,alpha-trehalose phosphorylase
LAFRLGFRGRRLLVEVERQRATYSLLEGSPLEISHHGEPLTVAGRRVVRPIRAAPAREAPSQPPGRAPLRRRPPSPTDVA